jgi:hypothetical protein
MRTVTHLAFQLRTDTPDPVAELADAAIAAF